MRPNTSPHRPLRSGELARLAGVSTDTLRYYERCRLLPAAQRSTAGYRLFPQDALMRVRMIRGALSIGFSVKELTGIFNERDVGGAPCHRVRTLAERKLADLATKLRELQNSRSELRRTLATWDKMLGKTSKGQRAGLLEAFIKSHPKSQKRDGHQNVLARGNRKRERVQ